MEIIDNVTDDSSIYQVGNVIKTDEGPALICSFIEERSEEKKYFSVSLESGDVLSDICDSLEELAGIYGDPSDKQVKATLMIERY